MKPQALYSTALAVIALKSHRFDRRCGHDIVRTRSWNILASRLRSLKGSSTYGREAGGGDVDGGEVESAEP